MPRRLIIQFLLQKGWINDDDDDDDDDNDHEDDDDDYDDDDDDYYYNITYHGRLRGS